MPHKKEHPENLQFNQEAFEHAKKLIRQGKINIMLDAWITNQPTPDGENQYLTDHNFNEYGNWFLATQDGTGTNTKEHYKFPIGNFKEIFRSGLIAAKKRAAEFKHYEIEQAASELLDIMDQGAGEA